MHSVLVTCVDPLVIKLSISDSARTFFPICTDNLYVNDQIQIG